MMDAAKFLYETFGIQHPRAFIAVSAIVGMLLFGGAAWLLVYGYNQANRREPPSSSVANSITPTSPPMPQESEPNQAERPQPGPPADRSIQIGDQNRFVNSPVISGDNVSVTTGIPEPQIEFRNRVENVANGELYKTEIMMAITTEVPIPSLYLQASAPTITEMEVIPQRSGLSISGHSGRREGLVFENLQGVYGSYLIRVFTKNQETLKIEYRVNR